MAKSVRELLIEKIENEFEIFYLTIRTMDASEIFQKSTEIEAKRTIVLLIKNDLVLEDETTLKRMLLCDSLLGEIYRYACDHKDNSISKNVKQYIEILKNKNVKREK